MFLVLVVILFWGIVTVKDGCQIWCRNFKTGQFIKNFLTQKFNHKSAEQTFAYHYSEKGNHRNNQVNYFTNHSIFPLSTIFYNRTFNYYFLIFFEGGDLELLFNLKKGEFY